MLFRHQDDSKVQKVSNPECYTPSSGPSRTNRNLILQEEVEGTSHMSDIRHMSVAMQRLLDFIYMVTNNRKIVTLMHYHITLEYLQKCKLPYDTY
jgi:hypothetical protein